MDGTNSFCADKTEHLVHLDLKEVFKCLHQTNLSLRGRKCHTAMSQVPCLGYVFSGVGMSPDRQKIVAVKEWPIPHNAADVRIFLGLASYYH